MRPRGGTLLLWAVAFWIAAVNTRWVGEPVLYAPREAEREAAHRNLLRDEPPAGLTWDGAGLGGTPIRRAALWAGEALLRAGARSVREAYFLLDFACIVLCTVLLWLWLRRWLREDAAALGLLFWGLSLPLTYHQHYFHPWDKPVALAWLLLLEAVRARRPWLLLAGVAAATFVKYDVAMLGPAWTLATWRERGRVRALAEGAAICLASLAVAAALGFVYLPAGERRAGVPEMGLLLGANLRDLRHGGLLLPPVLMFGLPAAGLAVAWRRLDPERRGLALAGALFLALFAATTYLREARAQIPVLFLWLPGALAAWPQPAAGRRAGGTASDVPAGGPG